MNKLLYLSSGSNQWGIGHLRRSLELVRVFSEKGIYVYTVALIPDRKSFQDLSTIAEVYDTCIQSLDEIKPFDARGVVIDVHTEIQPEILYWLKKQCKTAFALDWYHEAEGVIAGTANLRGGEEYLKYAIIRKEFQDALLNKSVSEPRYDAVVVIGGGDNRKHLHRIYRFFENDHFVNKKIVMLLGPMVEGEIDQLAETSSGTITVLKSPGNIAEIMADTYLGITNGGTTLMEFTMLGIPAIIFPQSEQEDNFIKTFLKKGSAVLGSFESEEFTRQITEIWDNEDLNKKMARKARELIDGQGAERIVNLVINTFLKENNYKNEGQSNKKN